MNEFFGVEAHGVLVALSFLVIVLIWLKLSSVRYDERKEMLDWCTAVSTCFAKNDFSCIPKGIHLKGIYRRLKMLEKFGIDVDVHYDKETLYVSKGKGKTWSFDIY
jgi:hypothetical protein